MLSVLLYSFYFPPDAYLSAADGVLTAVGRAEYQCVVFVYADDGPFKLSGAHRFYFFSYPHKPPAVFLQQLRGGQVLTGGIKPAEYSPCDAVAHILAPFSKDRARSVFDFLREASLRLIDVDADAGDRVFQPAGLRGKGSLGKYPADLSARPFR